MLGRDRQRVDSCAHCLVGGAQNIYPIDLDVIDNPNRPADLRVPDKFMVNFFPQLRQELLGILQFPMAESLRQNHRGCDHRTRQCAPAGFVDPSNPGYSEGPQFFFMPEPAAPIHKPQITRMPRIEKRED